MHAVVEAYEFSKKYSRNGPWAIRDVSLSIPAGGIVGLVGPNGAGKSTLLKTWVGFERPTLGRVLTLGSDPWTRRVEVLSKVAYLPQSVALYRELTVEDHLDYVAYYRRADFDREYARRRLRDLGIAANAAATNLSGGQAAQVALAIALGLHANVLILDEPLASLDPLARREFIDVLRDETERSGATAILSSHIVSDIEQACGRLVVLSVGRVELTGDVKGILESHGVCDVTGEDERGFIAQLPSGKLLCRDEGRPHSGFRAATLDDVVLGYLVRAREAGK